MRYEVRNTPRGANLYPAAGAVGRGAPGGTAEMLTLLRKFREGAGEPSDGRRWGVSVDLANAAGADGSLAKRWWSTGHRVQTLRGRKDLEVTAE